MNIFGLPLAAALVSVAAASEPDACAAITSGAERLACYDKHFDTRPRPASQKAGDQIGASIEHKNESSAATEAGDMAGSRATVHADAQRATSAEIDRSSSDRPASDRQPGPFSRERLQVESTVAAVRADFRQKMIFRLANDQIWIQSSPRELPIREGDHVTVTSATMGGYFLRTSTGVSTRVQRIK